MNSASIQPAGLNLWRSVWLLLRLRLTILIIGFRHARRLRQILIVVGILFFLGILGVVFYLSWLLLGFLNRPEFQQIGADTSSLIQSVPVLLISGAFLAILITSFGVLLQVLYLAGDMDFLLSRPVQIRAVFIAKLLQAVLPNFALISLIALPVLYGLGLSQGFNFLYYPLVIVTLVILALAAAGISSLLVMLIVRVFPARRVAEVLGFVGATLSFLCSQSGQIANWGDVSADQATQALTNLQRLNTPWSPLSWAGRGLMDIGAGSWLSGVFFVLLTLGLAGGAFALSLVTAERLYYSGWASMQARHQRKHKAPRKTARAALPAVSFFERLVPPVIRAIMVKDWIVLRRDLRNMSQLVTPLILGIVYAVMFLRGGSQPPAGRGEAPPQFMNALGNIYVYINVGISLFVSWMLLGRLAGMAFSHEGKSYWLLKSAPVKPIQLVAAKFLMAYVPVLILSWAFLLVIWLLQNVRIAILLFSLPVVALSIAGNAGINLTFGITGANMTWENPRQMQRGSASCLGSLATFVYLPLDLILFFGPSIAARFFGLPDILGQVIGLTLGAAFSLACTFIPLSLVSNRIPRLGEA